MKAVPELEITFMGTGTSHGVPMIGCDCEVCRSEDPRDSRLRTAVILRTPEAVIAIDTPPDFRTQCLRERITSIDAVLYTHAHTDHIMGFDDLRRFCDLGGRDMPIYAAPDVMADLRRVFQFAFAGDSGVKHYIRPEPREVTGPFTVGGLDFHPVELPHGRYIVTGYVISRGGRKLAAYMTDCNAVPPAAVEAARGVEILIVDALRHRWHPTHMNVEQATAAAREIGARRTYFTHLAHDLGHAETEAALPADIRLAFDGLRISVDDSK